MNLMNVLALWKKNREMKLNEYRPPEWEQKEELEKVGMNRGDWVHEN